MHEVHAKHLPGELHHVEIGAEMTECDGLLDELLERGEPPLLEQDQLRTNWPFTIIQVGSSSHKRTTARQARTWCPSQPQPDKRTQTWQALGGMGSGLDHLLVKHVSGGVKELDLQIFS